jgi:transcriptional regulator with XRE-family HTH domain
MRLMEGINERVVKVRKMMGLKQRDFAKIICVTQSTLSLIETGKQSLSKKNAKIISQSCNVNYEWLMFGVGPMSSAPTDDEQAIVNQVMASDDAEIKRIIVEICKLPPSERKLMKEFVNKLHRIISSETYQQRNEPEDTDN